MNKFKNGFLALILGMVLAHMGFMFYDSWQFWVIFIIYALGTI
jgi:hypothetical protein